MNVSSTVWEITIVGLVALFIVDFIVVERRAHAFTPAEASRWVLVYVLGALAFAAYVWTTYGGEYGKQFIAGWVTEYSLSVDNLFVFIVLMASFSVPPVLKHRVLLIGVAIAIVLRAVLIVAGAAAVQRFQGTFFLFGAFLAYTAWKVWGSVDEEPDPEGNALVRRLERVLPVENHYHGSALTVKIDGVRKITPMLLVVIAVGTTDLLFALDSIPAVLGLTQESYLVLTANAFALMGLRQLYFLLDGLLGKIIYLSKGLAVILGFIAVKLLLEATHAVFHLNVPTVSITASLGFIAVTLVVTVLVSLRAVSRDPSLAKTSPVAHAAEEAQEHQGEALEGMDRETP